MVGASHVTVEGTLGRIWMAVAILASAFVLATTWNTKIKTDQQTEEHDSRRTVCVNLSTSFDASIESKLSDYATCMEALR